MKKCDPNARARCPDGKNCELYAEYADGSWCSTFNELAMKQPITNADRIRAMSDEELAALLAHETYRMAEPVFTVCGYGLTEECIIIRRLHWLQQPAEGE